MVSLRFAKDHLTFVSQRIQRSNKFDSLVCTLRWGCHKRSIVLKGRKTSVSLKTEFWEGLRDCQRTKKQADGTDTSDRQRSEWWQFILSYPRVRFQSPSCRQPSVTNVQ